MRRLWAWLRPRIFVTELARDDFEYSVDDLEPRRPDRLGKRGTWSTDPTYFGTCPVCNGWLPHDDVGDVFCKMGIPDNLVGDARISTAKLLTIGLSKGKAAECVAIAWALFGHRGITGAAIYVDRIALILQAEGLVQRLEGRS